MNASRKDGYQDRPSKAVEVVRYEMGAEGYTNVERYDLSRYEGAANRYKTAVMANAYTRLIGDLRGKRVLDVGCGTGRGVVDFAQGAVFAAGADASLDMLSVARQKTAGNSRAAFVNAYAQHLPFRNSAFDMVISLNFLHLFSVATQREMVGEMKRVVKPGGVVIIELDNALQGLLIGPYKRWTGRERGSLPWEIRHLVGDHCRVVRYYGAVLPILWRIFYRLPRFFAQVEKLERFPPLNRLSHRIYCKIVTDQQPATSAVEGVEKAQDQPVLAETQSRRQAPAGGNS
jgi:ubiquinone/menaquinone biosynthesis C-methylase UbiE